MNTLSGRLKNCSLTFVCLPLIYIHFSSNRQTLCVSEQCVCRPLVLSVSCSHSLILAFSFLFEYVSWEDALAAKIEEIRVKELKLLRFSLFLQATNQTLLFVTPAIVTAVIMSTYAALGNEVNTSNTFAILAFINIIRNPTLLIPFSMSALAEAQVGVKRIQSFLQLEELTPRKRRPFDPSIPYSVAVRNGCFLLVYATHSDESGEIEFIVLFQLMLAHLCYALCICRWAADQPVPTLRDVNLTIKPGMLVAIIGLVGSGKTSVGYPDYTHHSSAM
jgi:ABC-type multidrug transport system fused ATPase/permease subunit